MIIPLFCAPRAPENYYIGYCGSVTILLNVKRELNFNFFPAATYNFISNLSAALKTREVKSVSHNGEKMQLIFSAFL